MNRTLTKAEEQIMQVLWEIEKGFLKEIVEKLPAPKPHSNTVATVLKILIEKGFVNYHVFGRQHQYHPLITKEEYSKKSLNGVVNSYFNGSYKQAVSFLVSKNELSIEELELLLNELKNT